MELFVILAAFGRCIIVTGSSILVVMRVLDLPLHFVIIIIDNIIIIITIIINIIFITFIITRLFEQEQLLF